MATVVTGTALNWAALSSAIEQFTTQTLGTYTLEFNNGKSLGARDNDTQLSIKHTLSSMYYSWDCCYSEAADVDTFNYFYGLPGEQFMIGNITADLPSSQNNILAQPGGWTDTDTYTINPELIRPFDFVTGDSMLFGSEFRYTFYGDTPATGGLDYFHMVLEVQPGLFSHWVTGQLIPNCAELTNRPEFGQFMSCTGPKASASTTRHVTEPFQSYQYNWAYTAPCNLIHFPEGTSAGEIDAGAHYQYRGTAANDGGIRQPNWCIGLGGLGAHTYCGPWQAGVDRRTGRVITTAMPLLLPYQDTPDNSFSPASGTAGDYLIPIGMIPGIRKVAIGELLAGDTFTLGADLYTAYPSFRRSTRIGMENFPDSYEGDAYLHGGDQTKMPYNADWTSGVNGFAYDSN